MHLLVLVILRLGVVGAIVSLGAIFSSYHLVFDLLSHFRIQYIVLISGVLFVALCCRRKTIAIVLFSCLGFHVFDVYHSVKPRESMVAERPLSLSVMSSNLLASNDDYAAHIRYIRSISPDIIVFQEYTYEWEAVLAASLVEYPYRIADPKSNPFGIALYSKLQLIDKKIVNLIPNATPSVEVVVSNGERELTVFGTHPPPPVSSKYYSERNTHLETIAERVSGHTDAVVVVGDLNVSPWSKHFTDFLEVGGLVDGRRGQGVLPTWPTWNAPLQIPIDFIVVNNAVNVVSMNTSRGLSSDHRTIWARLEF